MPAVLPELDEEGWTSDDFVRDMPVDYTLLVENLLDPGQTLHASLSSFDPLFFLFPSGKHDCRQHCMCLDHKIQALRHKAQSVLCWQVDKKPLAAVCPAAVSTQDVRPVSDQ